VNRTLYVTGVITGFVFITGVLFKIMHWPGAAIALLSTIILAVAVFIPVLVTHALKDKENQLQSFSILIFVLSFMAINVMVFVLRTSKNVLHSMRSSAKENIMTSRMLASGNTLVLEAAQMDSTISPKYLEQANLLHTQTIELDKYLGEIMADILVETHEDNLLALDENGLIDLDRTNYLDVHRSTEKVIFGSELVKGKGKDLVKSLETHKALLLDQGDPELDRVINEVLDLRSTHPENVSWLQETFDQTPMIGAMISLSNLQFKIQFLEGELLKELL